MSRWQLSDKATPVAEGRGRGRMSLFPVWPVCHHITSHRSRNLVKLISSSAIRVLPGVCCRYRLVAGTIDLAACHDCPDGACCPVCHRDGCDPHGLSRE